MRVSELIDHLQNVLREDGDIPVKIDQHEEKYSEHFAVQTNTIPRRSETHEQVPYVVLY